MYSKDFLLKDTHGLEQEIERHCAGLGLQCSNAVQIHQFAREMLHDMEQIKAAASKGDRTARAKIEQFGMVVMMHEANIKAFGANYMTQLNALAQDESAWMALAKAMWSELESRNLDGE